MKKENVLHGWRNPNENAEVDRPILAVFRDPTTNFTFTTIVHSDIKHARTHPYYTLLAWQYLPEWVED